MSIALMLLDYWLNNYCKINLKCHTIEAYSNIVKNHLKPNLGFYKLSQITKTTIQEFLNKVYVEKGYSKNFLNNIRKVLKCSFNYATDNEYVKVNPALNLTLLKYDAPPSDPAYIFTNEEMQEENKINYGDTYMKHYKKSVINPFNNKAEKNCKCIF